MADGRMEIIRELCSFEGRVAGSDAERRAANRLVERLRGQGRRAEVEPTYVHPKYGLVHAVHCGLGFAGSLVAIAEPAAGFALVLFAAAAMYLDLNYRLYVVRRLFFRRASQNVVSPGPRPDAPLRLIVTAHYDAARTGAAFAPRRVALLARLERRLGVPLGPFRILFWSLAALLPLLGARMAGFESQPLAIVQLVPTLVLLVGIFALVEIELSPVVPAANDNASGVAAALRLAAALDADPPQHLDVWVVLPGAGECQQEGMRAFVRAHRRELDRERTAFLDLEALGHGQPRYHVSEGWVASYGMDRRLVELAEAIATADRERERRYGAAPLRSGSASEALPPRVRGHRSLAISCAAEDGTVPHRRRVSDRPETLDPATIERAEAFALEIVRRLDLDVGRTSR